jgi:hypothetical protein
MGAKFTVTNSYPLSNTVLVTFYHQSTYYPSSPTVVVHELNSYAERLVCYIMLVLVDCASRK